MCIYINVRERERERGEWERENIFAFNGWYIVGNRNNIFQMKKMITSYQLHSRLL